MSTDSHPVPEHLHDATWWRAVLEPQVPGDALLGARVLIDKRAPGKTSRIHHVELEWAQGTGPTRLLVKHSHPPIGDLPVDPPPQWRVEGEFYRRLVGTAGTVSPDESPAIAAPRCWFAHWSADGREGLLVLDLLDAARAWRHPIGEREFHLALPLMATMHASTWDGRGVDLSWAPDGDLLFARQMPTVWPLIRDRFGTEARALFDEVIPLIPAVVERTRQGMRCLVHGDLSPRNIIGDRRGAVRMIDFGTATHSIGAVDVARLASACPTIAGDAQGHRAACEAWRGELISRGVRGYDAEHAWRDYCDGLLLNAQYAGLPGAVPADEARSLERAIAVCMRSDGGRAAT